MTSTHSDRDRVRGDEDFLHQALQYLSSLPWGAIECRCKTSRARTYLPNLVTGHTGCLELFEQSPRTGHRVDQDPDHCMFDLRGGDPPALGAFRSRLGDQRGGDVVAIASAVLDGVRWGEPVPLRIGEQARQQARFGGVSTMSMAAGIGGEPVANRAPGFSLDQRWMLAGVEFALMRYLTSVNRVRQQPIDVPRENALPPRSAPLAVVRRFVSSPRQSASSFTRRTQPNSR